jgi:hypothetical protein
VVRTLSSPDRRADKDRNSELRKNIALEAFHHLGIIVVFVIVSYQMQEAVHGQVAEMMLERLVFTVGFVARGLIGNRDVAEHARRIVVVTHAFRCSAGNDSTLVGLSMPRQFLFSVRIPASSVSMTATSASAVSASTMEAAASMAR